MPAQGQVQLKLSSFIRPARESARRVNMLIYGDSGVGKTYLAATADSSEWGHPALLIDVESGKKTVEDWDIDVVTISEIAEAGRVSQWRALRSLVDHLMDGKLPKYKSVIVDSVSEVYQIALLDVVTEAHTLKPAEVDPDMPHLQHYQVAGNRFKRLVRDLRNLSVNTIFTALATEITDNRTMKKEVIPLLTEKLAAQMPAYLDNVAYLYVTTADPERPAGQGNPLKRILLTAPSGKYRCKDRGGKLGSYVDEPTMDKVFRLMYAPEDQQPGSEQEQEREQEQEDDYDGEEDE